jgi:hypothetical protein
MCDDSDCKENKLDFADGTPKPACSGCPFRLFTFVRMAGSPMVTNLKLGLHAAIRTFVCQNILF